MRRRQIVSRVLELKKLILERHELELKRGMGELDIEKAKLDFLDEAMKNTREGFKQKNGIVNIGELEILVSYLIQLSKDIKDQEESIRTKSREVEEKQKEMLEAYKENRILEILNDKMSGEENKKASLAEQKWADFLSLSKEARK